MTDEKMALQYADSYDLMNKDLSPKSPRHIVMEVFLAGLEAGRPKWHDLRKNPNDLPDDSRTVLDEARGRFYYFRGHFYSVHGSRLDHVPIAWCDIPVFEEADE